MKLVKEYQHFDRFGKAQGGSHAVVNEFIVLSPGERRVFTYLTAVVGGTLLLSELAIMLNVLLSWSLTGSHSIVSPAVWGWKIIWLVVIGLIAMPLTALGTASIARHTWFTQAERINEERSKSKEIVKRQDEDDAIRHRARQALVVAAENNVYDALARKEPPDIRALRMLEMASKAEWDESKEYGD